MGTTPELQDACFSKVQSVGIALSATLPDLSEMGLIFGGIVIGGICRSNLVGKNFPIETKALSSPIPMIVKACRAAVRADRVFIRYFERPHDPVTDQGAAGSDGCDNPVVSDPTWIGGDTGSGHTTIDVADDFTKIVDNDE